MLSPYFGSYLADNIGVIIVAGLIPASIAGRKGHNFLFWWMFGVALLIIALAVGMGPIDIERGVIEPLALIVFGLPVVFLLKRKVPPTISPASAAVKKTIHVFTALLLYVIFGVAGVIIGAILAFVATSNDPDGMRGTGFVQTLLCLVSGLVFCSYFRGILPRRYEIGNAN